MTVGMRIGVAIATSDAPPSAFVVWRGLKESIKKAAEFGYDGVELALAESGQIDIEMTRDLCLEVGIEICSVSTGQVFAAKGLFLTHPDRDRREETVTSLKGLIDVASRLGKRMNIGRVRGPILEGDSYEDASKRFMAGMRELADYAGAKDVEILVEPVNRYELNFINNLSEAAGVLQRLDRDNVRIMPDVFHMNIEDASITGQLVRFAEQISYIHLADSNRLAPGQGHLHFPDLINTLEGIGYDGWLTVEVLPQPGPDIAARQSISYLRQLIPRN